MERIRQQDEIVASWLYKTTTPVLSICCITYNHEKYIEDALKGFLLQETNFPFEIIVYDDASTDNTAEIIAEYSKNYPGIIKPVLQSENQYSQGNRPLRIITPLCKGKYIALCEGDDFWSDPRKLQIQVDFLESNPDYVISGHDVRVINQHGVCIRESRVANKQKRDFSMDSVVKGEAFLPTASRVYRNILPMIPQEFCMVKACDYFLLSLLGQYGKSKYHSDIQPAIYRKHSDGVWSMVSEIERIDAQINTNFWMYRYYMRIGETKYAHHYWKRFLSYTFRATRPIELIMTLVNRLLKWKWNSPKR